MVVRGDASAGVLVKNSPDTSVASSSVTNDVSAFQSDGVDVLSSARTIISDNRLVKNVWNGMFVLASPEPALSATHLMGTGTRVSW